MLSAERSLKSITSAFNDKPDPGPSRYQVLYNPTTQQLVGENVTSIMNLRFRLYAHSEHRDQRMRQVVAYKRLKAMENHY